LPLEGEPQSPPQVGIREARPRDYFPRRPLARLPLPSESGAGLKSMCRPCGGGQGIGKFGQRRNPAHVSKDGQQLYNMDATSSLLAVNPFLKEVPPPTPRRAPCNRPPHNRFSQEDRSGVCPSTMSHLSQENPAWTGFRKQVRPIRHRWLRTLRRS